MKKQYATPKISIEALFKQDVLLSSNPSESRYLNPEDKINNDGNSVPVDLWSSIWGP